MKFIETKLSGAYIVETDKRGDSRGFFARAFCQREFADHGLNGRVVQANISYSAVKGTLRGMHFQKAPYAEVKLVRCLHGAIYDVFVDLRPESPSYCKWEGVRLDSEALRAVLVPEGFAHGFLSLTEDTTVLYQVSEFYNPDAEGGVRWNDPRFEIEWPFDPVVISEKDRNHPDFED